MKTPREMLEEFTFADEWLDPVEQAVVRRDEQWKAECAKVARAAVNYCRGNDIGQDLRSVSGFVFDCVLAGKVLADEDET